MSQCPASFISTTVTVVAATCHLNQRLRVNLVESETHYPWTVTLDSPNPDAALLRKYRIRVALFLVAVVVVVALLSLLYKSINTIYVLNAVEAERDQWQKPSAVISPLNLKNGDVVADVGSGAGYFSLKLSPVVGPSGTVLAVDLRRLPLVFLWIRAFLAGLHNVRIHVGESDDPHLPVGTVDAALIANTYHEFAAPELMLDHVFKSLRPGGRLVVIDRSPTSDESGSEAEHHHQISRAAVEAQFRQKGLEILKREDQFIRRRDEQWWLLIAQR
jgi:ubiquinone/menaquinone biosynthesis C-methylase UbiE